MTKKATEILENFIAKINTIDIELLEYTNEEKATKIFDSVLSDYLMLIVKMFNYRLLSVKEYNNLYALHDETLKEIVSVIMFKHYGNLDV